MTAEKLQNNEKFPSREQESIQTMEFANVHKIFLSEFFKTGLHNEVKRTIESGTRNNLDELRQKIV